MIYVLATLSLLVVACLLRDYWREHLQMRRVPVRASRPDAVRHLRRPARD